MGRSEEEALDNIKEAIELYLEQANFGTFSILRLMVELAASMLPLAA